MQNLLFTLLIISVLSCKSKTEDDPIITDPPEVFPVQVWTTSANQASLLSRKTLDFATGRDDRFTTITIDTTVELQPIEGFGYTLTGGSAMLLHQMNPTERAALLQAFFGKNDNAIGVSYLRLSIGASDLDAEVFSYDDLPAGQTDPDLQQFSIAKDEVHLIPVLKEILAINPAIKLMGSPWSPPAWMKTNGSSKGGNLKPEYYAAYAQYFVRYIQAYKSHSIDIEAITPQNEPHHGGNNPSMEMSSAQQADFIKNHLGPAFQAAFQFHEVFFHFFYPSEVSQVQGFEAFRFNEPDRSNPVFDVNIRRRARRHHHVAFSDADAGHITCKQHISHLPCDVVNGMSRRVQGPEACFSNFYLFTVFNSNQVPGGNRLEFSP